MRAGRPDRGAMGSDDGRPIREAERAATAGDVAGRGSEARVGGELREEPTTRSAMASRMGLAIAQTPEPDWLIVEEGFHLAREHEIESLFTVSNGYAGTRGALAEGSALSS